ncbi:MAG: 5-formyltetrahydrofolate cyclo-ligase, partial [Alistipes sp.]|nr:5-formyltetrahydrofolate cyclo-ligase [Alistipes sp.]
MTKKELRAMMKRRNLALAGDVRRRMSEQLIGRIGELPEFAAARCVGLFCALPDEPDMTAALAAWSCGKRVVVPRVEGETMQFYDYDRATMVCGAFGIAEPGAGARVCRPEEIELVVVPGVAFDRCGARLG